MKLCDRCFHEGDYVKSVDAIKFANTHETFDLCETCSQIVREFAIGKRYRKLGEIAQDTEK